MQMLKLNVNIQFAQPGIYTSRTLGKCKIKCSKISTFQSRKIMMQRK